MCEITKENGATNDHAMRDYTIELPWLGVCEVGNPASFVRIDMLEDDVELPIKEIRASLLYRDISVPRPVPFERSARGQHLGRPAPIAAPEPAGIPRRGPEARPPGMARRPASRSTYRAGRGLATTRRFRAAWTSPATKPRCRLDERHACSYSLWWVLIHRDYRYVPRRPGITWNSSNNGPQRPDEDPDGARGTPKAVNTSTAADALDWLTSERHRWPSTPAQYALMLMTFEAGAEKC